MLATSVFSEIVKQFSDENQSTNAHFACYIVHMYICMFKNSKGLKKSLKVTLKLVIFSVDFETTDHTKILECHDYIFNVFHCMFC